MLPLEIFRILTSLTPSIRNSDRGGRDTCQGFSLKKKEKPWGRGCSASTLNPPMQRNITRKPRSHISKACRLQSEEQRTTLNAVPTDI